MISGGSDGKAALAHCLLTKKKLANLQLGWSGVNCCRRWIQVPLLFAKPNCSIVMATSNCQYCSLSTLTCDVSEILNLWWSVLDESLNCQKQSIPSSCIICYFFNVNYFVTFRYSVTSSSRIPTICVDLWTVSNQLKSLLLALPAPWWLLSVLFAFGGDNAYVVILLLTWIHIRYPCLPLNIWPSSSTLCTGFCIWVVTIEFPSLTATSLSGIDVLQESSPKYEFD